MKLVLTKVMEMLKSRFPSTPILPNIGNNDLLHHYQEPNATERAYFYGDLYDLWFD